MEDDESREESEGRVSCKSCFQLPSGVEPLGRLLIVSTLYIGRKVYIQCMVLLSVPLFRISLQEERRRWM